MAGTTTPLRISSLYRSSLTKYFMNSSAAALVFSSSPLLIAMPYCTTPALLTGSPLPPFTLGKRAMPNLPPSSLLMRILASTVEEEMCMAAFP
ncbi:hypothetical protein D3C81_2131510 [compost metagenome]